MKKTRILALVLAVAIMMVGAGYAAWSDTLTISHTVNTGKLDVNFVSGSNATFESGYTVATGNAVVDSTNKNLATITLNNLYPGAVATLTLTVKNDSSIPVKDGQFVFTNLPTWLTAQASDVSTLAVGETKTATFTFTVGENAPNNLTGLPPVTFTAAATYNQFNK